MPLKAGSSQSTIRANISEMMNAYKRTGKIGNTKPRNLKHALEIATAAALAKARSK